LPPFPLPDPLLGGGCEPPLVLDGVDVVVGVEDVEVVTVAAGVVAVTTGAQTSDTLATGPTPGGTNDDAGVPGAALTVNVSV
jgi:hypothetical protein